jgi:hypothetical protein
VTVTLDRFQSLAHSTWFSSQDIAVSGQGKNVTAKLGNLVFSSGRETNDATMAAFKAALEKEYGVFGTNAFDTILGARSELHKSLRAMDIRRTLSNLPQMRHNRFVDELNRQLDTSPQMLELSKDDWQKVRNEINKDIQKGTDLTKCKTAGDVAAAAQKRIESALNAVRDEAGGLETSKVGPREKLSRAATGREATGLRNLDNAFGKKETSVADLMKRGLLGAGMRVNRSGTNPVLLEKLKTNGVEPGFIYRNDWSQDDTRGLMADPESPESLKELDHLKKCYPELARKCEGKSVRRQIMLAGLRHSAGMAAVAEFALQDAAQVVIAGKGKAISGYCFKALAEGLKNHFSNEELKQIADGTAGKAVIKEAKQYLFAQLREAVMNVKPDNDFHEFSPIFKHFSDRAIVKLDYNESTKFSSGDSAHAGTFMRPERILNTRGSIIGQIYRFTSRQSADTISAGAVTEALANDLTRIAGVPAQELEIVRGQYSDGHPKIMLAAKFANGYKDLEAGMLKDGRVVKPKDALPGMEMEKLGKYKAFFLVTADRDGVGKRGQNKGFVGGQFFAIDPGHSLEGNGKYLEVSSDLSFRDTYGKSVKPRFNNFSVFDDDTFFSKLEGVVNLRQLVQSGAFKNVFDDYRRAFNPNEAGISDAEKALRQKVVADIDMKEAEFNESMKKILDVSDNNLQLYDDLKDSAPAVREGAVETVANLEKLTSPTTWVSKKGKVALDHLEVIPESRVPWKAAVKGNDIVYFCEKPLSYETKSILEGIAKSCGAHFESDALGLSRLVVPKDKAEAVFAAFSEKNVQKLTHPDEYLARQNGGDGLKEAKTWKPVPYKTPGADPRPLLDPAIIPERLDVPIEYGGKEIVIQIPKVHVQDLVATRSHVHRPRTVGELRNFVAMQIKRGNEVLGALQNGKTRLFEPTRENIVALTWAVHAAALRKGEFMYRGSFSIEDKDGNIARWLDRASDVYLRTSTHATPYQGMKVDGHLNMPRGYDVPGGAGGLLNGMRTFHYFTIPDTDSIKNGGDGSGPRRRLFLKCETFGIFASTAHLHPFNKADAKGEGMKTRGYRPGDIIESIQHGASLFKSFFTPKEAPGIRKENLTEAQKTAINAAVESMHRLNLHGQAEMLITDKVLDGGGIKTLTDNVAYILDKMMPEDAGKRADLMAVFDKLLDDFAAATTAAGGEVADRIGNEIMIDAKDLVS